MVLHDHCGGDASVRLCRVCVCVDIVPDLCITTCDLVGSSGSMLGVSHWSHPLMFGARVQLLSSLCAKMKYFTGTLSFTRSQKLGSTNLRYVH